MEREALRNSAFLVLDKKKAGFVIQCGLRRAANEVRKPMEIVLRALEKDERYEDDRFIIQRTRRSR